MDHLLTNLGRMPPITATVVWLTVLTTLALGYGAAGALVIALGRYPPRRGRSRLDVARSRRQWALTFVLLAIVQQTGYRLWRIVETPTAAIPWIGLVSQCVVFAAAFSLVWAFRRGND